MTYPYLTAQLGAARSSSILSPEVIQRVDGATAEVRNESFGGFGKPFDGARTQDNLRTWLVAAVVVA
jgi:hypothetical protein